MVQNPRPVCIVSGQPETADVDGTFTLSDMLFVYDRYIYTILSLPLAMFDDRRG